MNTGSNLNSSSRFTFKFQIRVIVFDSLLLFPHIDSLNVNGVFDSCDPFHVRFYGDSTCVSARLFGRDLMRATECGFDDYSESIRDTERYDHIDCETRTSINIYCRLFEFTNQDKALT